MRTLRKFLRDRAAVIGGTIILLLVVAAVFAPVLSPFPGDVYDFHTPNRLRAPDATHWFGTDRMGSDVFSRVMYGARITITIAVIAIGVTVIVGVPIGLVAGYFGGWLSDGLMRISDIFLAVPQVVLAIAIAQTLGPSLPNVILALSLTYWPWFARVVYAETRALQKEVFIESTSALGASPLRLTVLHVLPNIASPIIVGELCPPMLSGGRFAICGIGNVDAGMSGIGCGSGAGGANESGGGVLGCCARSGTGGGKVLGRSGRGRSRGSGAGGGSLITSAFT